MTRGGRVQRRLEGSGVSGMGQGQAMKVGFGVSRGWKGSDVIGPH